MPFFDTHTHLDYLHHDTGEPLAQLVDNAKQADVQKILIVAVKESDFKTSQFTKMWCGAWFFWKL